MNNPTIIQSRIKYKIPRYNKLHPLSSSINWLAHPVNSLYFHCWSMNIEITEQIKVNTSIICKMINNIFGYPYCCLEFVLWNTNFNLANWNKEIVINAEKYGNWPNWADIVHNFKVFVVAPMVAKIPPITAIMQRYNGRTDRFFNIGGNNRGGICFRFLYS